MEGFVFDNTGSLINQFLFFAKKGEHSQMCVCLQKLKSAYQRLPVFYQDYGKKAASKSTVAA